MGWVVFGTPVLGMLVMCAAACATPPGHVGKASCAGDDAVCATSNAASEASGALPLTVMTFNIRYGTAKDGENSWERRRDLLVETVKRHEPDVLSTQEGLDFQLAYLQRELGDTYRWFGMARDADGTGEHAAVFYRRDRLTPVECGNFWLSETPLQPGTKSWGSHHNRLTTWARFHHHGTGRSFVLLNTHLDNGSDKARREGARMLAERVRSIEDCPVVVTGDFNSTAEASEPWALLTDTGLVDAWRAARERSGPSCTFNGFRSPGADTDRRIDWILVSPSVEVRSCETVTNSRDNRYPSDHFPVVARMCLLPQ